MFSRPNAMRQQSKAHPDDGPQTLTKHRTVMREEYAETAERGLGLLHAIVNYYAFFLRYSRLSLRVLRKLAATRRT